MDQYRIDSHKLMYHVPRVNDWLQGKMVYPIYMEVSPSGTCNHRCVFCAKDFMGYEKNFLDMAMMESRLQEMGRLGVKSIMYAGEGEPLLHPEFAPMVNCTKDAGMDVAITTNGVLLSPELAEKILSDLSWIKVSINAGTEDTYSKIHRAPKKDFSRVIENITRAVIMKEKEKSDCVIGMQMLLLPENRHEAVSLAKAARDAGAAYLVIKPYSQHHLSQTRTYEDMTYEDAMTLAHTLEEINTDRFKVVFRANAMRNWDKGELGFPHCLALPFWAYIDAEGNVWGCSSYLKDDRFLYGNLYDKGFMKIWEGEQRLQALKNIEENRITEHCRVNCRMGEINKYLWALKVPPPHVNFI